jgi:preprotein translocase subunit YajC
MVIHAVSALLMAPAEGGNPMMVLMVQLGLIFLIFYWLLIRPQRKERQRHDAMIAALQKGDEVVTAGGIIGTILRVEEDRLTIKTDRDTRLVVERSKVGRKLEPAGSGPA